MTIRFKDFVPEVTSMGIFRNPTAPSLKEITEDVNSWVEKTNTKIINIETVIVPNLNIKDYQSQSISSTVNGSAYHLQIIRVWYKE